MYGLKILVLCLIASAPAFADTLIQLSPPLGVEGQPGRTTCVTSKFNADHSIAGVCSSPVSQACSGRGCNPATVTTIYIVAWDAQGLPLSAVACESVRHHTPQLDVTTYLNGYTKCPPETFNPTSTVVVLDGLPLWYVAADPTTGAEIANSNVLGYLYLP